MMKEHAQGDIILEEDDGIYEKGDILRSFHHHASSDVVLPIVLLRPFVWYMVIL